MSHFTTEADELVSAASTGRVAKRAIDILLAMAALIVAAPLMIAIFAAIGAGRGGPLFSQVRVGQGGRRFRCLKFRTMRQGAEAELPDLAAGLSAGFAEDWAAFQKAPKDPRITRFGKVLRRWGLDELPQLFNILKGEMSFVGPRPVVAPETSGYPADRAYAASAAFAAYRSVRPGLTGLWQVSGGAETTHAERVRLDQAYVANWSFWLDLRILAATPAAVLRRRYG